MNFNDFSMPDLMSKIDTSFIDEMNKRNQKILNNITPFNEVLANEIKPIIEGNQKVIEGLNNNYTKLNDLYILKEKELEDSKQEATKAKKYNTIMLIITLVSAGIALASLVATVLIAIL
jgi:archaellum component FlaC